MSEKLPARIKNANILRRREKAKKHFIAKASSLHNGKYDYSEINYINNHHKVSINCPEHGLFQQAPMTHVDSRKPCGCPSCGDMKRKAKRIPQAELNSREQQHHEKIQNNKKNRIHRNKMRFIQDAQLAHGEKYDYSQVNYINSITKVDVICPTHGVFSILPGNHKKGVGCVKCSNEQVAKTKFVNRAKSRLIKFQKVHGSRYRYKDLDQLHEITVECRIHGEFKQRPSVHARGGGCRKCGQITCARKNKRNARLKENQPVWGYEDWKRNGEQSENFDSFKMYMVECEGDGERFIKVGKTFRRVEDRISKIPYKTKIVGKVIGSAFYISRAEEYFHRENKNRRYQPKKKFDGHNECFSVV